MAENLILLGAKSPLSTAESLNLDSEGNLKVSVDGVISGGGSSGGGMSVKDADTGKNAEITAIKDDQGEYVLRVTDSSPYLVKLSKYDTPSHTSVNVTTTSLLSVSESPKRKYLEIFNLGEDIVFLSFGVSASDKKGIPVMPKKSYEMSALKGNLYDGSIYAISDTGNNKLNVIEGV